MKRTLNDHRAGPLTLARSVTADRKPNGSAELFIDGEHFPYYVGKGGPIADPVEQGEPWQVVWIPLLVEHDRT